MRRRRLLLTTPPLLAFGLFPADYILCINCPKGELKKTGDSVSNTLKELVRSKSVKLRQINRTAPATNRGKHSFIDRKWIRRYFRVRIKHYFQFKRGNRWAWYEPLAKLLPLNFVVSGLGLFRRHRLAHQISAIVFGDGKITAGFPLIFPPTSLERESIEKTFHIDGLERFGLPKLVLDQSHVGPSLYRLAFGGRTQVAGFGGVESEQAIAAVGMTGAYAILVKEPKSTYYEARIFGISLSVDGYIEVIEISNVDGRLYLRAGVSVPSSDYSLAILSDMLGKDECIDRSSDFFADPIPDSSLFSANEEQKENYQSPKSDSAAILQHQRLRVYSHRIGSDHSIEGRFLYKDTVGRMHGIKLKDKIDQTHLQILKRYNSPAQPIPPILGPSYEILQSYSDEGLTRNRRETTRSVVS